MWASLIASLDGWEAAGILAELVKVFGIDWSETFVVFFEIEPGIRRPTVSTVRHFHIVVSSPLPSLRSVCMPRMDDPGVAKFFLIWVIYWRRAESSNVTVSTPLIMYELSPRQMHVLRNSSKILSTGTPQQGSKVNSVGMSLLALVL